MTVNPGSNYEGVNVRGEPACGNVYVCVWVISSEQGEETVSVGAVEEGDAAHHHHSALVPLITSLCFTASLHNNYPACSFEGSRPLSPHIVRRRTGSGVSNIT